MWSFFVERFCENVRVVFECMCLVQTDGSCDDLFLYIVVLSVDVFTSSMILGVMRKMYTRLIVVKKYDGLLDYAAELKE